MSSFTVGGLSTGIDYNDLVSKLIEIERRPITILEDKISTYNSKISSYGEIGTKLSALKTAVDKLKTTSNFYVKDATVSDTTVLDATASGTASVGNYSISVTELASEEKEVHNGTGLTASSDVVNSSGSDKVFQYTYDGTQRSITVADGTTLDELKNLINDDTDNPGVAATLVNDGTNYRLILTGKETGDTKTITIDAGSTLSGFSAADFSEQKTANNAVFSVDSLQISRSTNAITDVIDGVTINLKKENASATVSVTADTDSIKEQIEDFVSAYNEVNDYISSNSSYDSTTGQGGILSGEGTARSIQDKLRSIVSGSVSGLSGDISVLAEMGITTDYKTGNLKIDSSTIDEKLGSNLDDIADLFKDTSNGIATQIYSYINTVTSSVDGAVTLRKDGLEDVISNINKTIRDLEYSIGKKEEALVKKFTSLEKLVSNFNTLGNYLTGFSTRI